MPTCTDNSKIDEIDNIVKKETGKYISPSNHTVEDIERLVMSTDYLQYRSFMNEYSDDLMEKYFNMLCSKLPSIKNKRNFSFGTKYFCFNGRISR